jgi:hypothetical protein
MLIDDLSVTIQYIHDDFSSSIQSLASLTNAGEITFDLLWAIFPPKTIVFTKDNLMNEPHAMLLISNIYLKNDDGSKYLSLKCKMLRHDGQDFGWAVDYLKIQDFDGAKKVTALPSFPLSAHPEEAAVRADLVKRGRRYIQLIGPICKEYRGFALKEQEGDPDRDKIEKIYVSVLNQLVC